MADSTTGAKRELLVTQMDTREVVYRQDVTGLSREAVADAAARLRARMNEQEYFLQDTGEKGPLDVNG